MHEETAKLNRPADRPATAREEALVIEDCGAVEMRRRRWYDDGVVVYIRRGDLCFFDGTGQDSGGMHFDQGLNMRL